MSPLSRGGTTVDAAAHGSLRRKTLRASVWTFGGHGLSMVLRLGSNLILTRLLMPEMFGLMALVNIFVIGLVMFSDVGIGPGIIQNKRGDDAAFLQTAWTIQAIRGVVLWIASCALAWPASILYHAEALASGGPGLSVLLPVAGLNALINGFNSTALFTYQRHLRVRPLVLIELGTQIVGVVVTIVYAALSPTVWALLVGALSGSVARMISSHVFLSGIRHRPNWERPAARALFTFGRWIFLSSVCTFLAAQGDRALLGKYVSLSMLGVYSIGAFLARSVIDAQTKLTHTVLFPAFSAVARDEPHRLREVFYRVRLRSDALFLPISGLLLTAGQALVHLLYRQEYHEAGWMLQLFAIQTAMACVLTPCETVLFATGHTRYGFLRSLARAVWILCGMPIAWHAGGLEGLVWVVALSEAPVLLVLGLAFVRHRLLDPLGELRALAFFGIGVGLGLLARPAFEILEKLL